jgi:hypothetical protein
MQSVIKIPSEGFFQREAVGTLSFDFSDEKFMFKRTWQVVFWGTRNDFGHPKQLATRLKARDGLHSKVVAPESGRRGTKNGKMNAVIYRLVIHKRPLLKQICNLPSKKLTTLGKNLANRICRHRESNYCYYSLFYSDYP